MSGISERNPFVGPRPIAQGEPLHGRSVEIRELYNRLQARRIVVLHSPSGAGKSSLVSAGLIPRLRRGGFDVWKPIRVNLDPSGLEGVPKDVNRYLLSALVSLEDELPAEHRRSPGELARLDLLEYLDSRPRRKGREHKPVVLLFDQFEEILTVAPRAIEAKRALFSAVGRALDTQKYWALFIIREDYLAAFTPYRDRIPTQMSNTFRLDLLGLEGAKEAAVALAEQGGRAFPAVDKLIRDLSTIQVQQPDGSYVAEQGLHVEPVHLQVVGRRLWEAMPDDDLSIDAEDIEAYAGVSEALGGYYDDAVARIAKRDAAVERSVREWVGTKLIVGGIRSQVRQEAKRSSGLDNALIKQLLDSYLVRTEQRAGANWYELSHDRLVEPVSQRNEAWDQAHLHPLQIQAKMWDDGGRASMLLMGAGALREAEAWAEQNPKLLTASEKEFLQLSQKARAEARRQRHVRVGIMAFTAIGALVSFVLFGIARSARKAADEERDIAWAAEQAAKDAEATAKAAEQAAKQAEKTATAAKERAIHEARVGRDVQRLFATCLAISELPEAVPPDKLIEGIGWLAELETPDFQEVMKTKMPAWPEFLAMLGGKGGAAEVGSLMAGLESKKIRALFWMLGQGHCATADKRMSLFGLSPKAAKDAQQRCETMITCLRQSCDPLESCMSDGPPDPLTSAGQAQFDACFEAFERSRQSVAYGSEGDAHRKSGFFIASGAAASEDADPSAGAPSLSVRPSAGAMDGADAGSEDGFLVGSSEGIQAGFDDGVHGRPPDFRQHPAPDPAEAGYPQAFASAYQQAYYEEYDFWYQRGYDEGVQEYQLEQYGDQGPVPMPTPKTSTSPTPPPLPPAPEPPPEPDDGEWEPPPEPDPDDGEWEPPPEPEPDDGEWEPPPEPDPGEWEPPPEPPPAPSSGLSPKTVCKHLAQLAEDPGALLPCTKDMTKLEAEDPEYFGEVGRCILGADTWEEYEQCPG